MWWLWLLQLCQSDMLCCGHGLAAANKKQVRNDVSDSLGVVVVALCTFTAETRGKPTMQQRSMARIKPGVLLYVLYMTWPKGCELLNIKPTCPC